MSSNGLIGCGSVFATGAPASAYFLESDAGEVAVTSITAGTGIAVTGTTSEPIVSNTGVLSVAAGTGITVSGTASAPVVNATGVQSVAAGTGVTVTGTATAPIVNATRFASGTTTVVAYPSGTALSATNSGATNVAPIVGSSIAVTPGEWLLITAQYAVASTTAVAGKTMSIFGQFQNIGRIIPLFSAYEGTAGIAGSSSFIIQVPAGNVPTFSMAVSGDVGGGVITGGVSYLAYSKLAL